MPMMGYLAPCPACGINGPCDDGHRLCLVCEGRGCRKHGRLDMYGRCRQCDNLGDDFAIIKEEQEGG